MNDPDQVIAWRKSLSDDLSAYEDSVDIDDRPAAGPGTGLVSLGFIWAALRRATRLLCALAVMGLIIGTAFAAKFPPPHTATVSVLLVDDPSLPVGTEVLTDLAMAESVPVATAVVNQLGLHQTPTSFAGMYTVIPTTDQVLTITAKGATSAAAVNTASAIATQFLKFRANYEETQLQENENQLNQQVAQAQQKLDSVQSEFNQVSAEPSGASQGAHLSTLQNQLTAATTALGEVEGYRTETLASAQTLARSMAQGSQVLNGATPGKRSVLKSAVLYAGVGLIGGLAVGMIIVFVGAVTSDRLRRRDDIAYVIEAPVRLSVGPLSRRLMPALPQTAASRRRDMQRVVDHLRQAVPGSPKRPAGLAVVAIDDTPTAAEAVVQLALSQAGKGKRVLVADLSDGAHAARLLKVGKPGIRSVSTNGVRVLVALTASNDIAPVGPLGSAASSNGYRQADEAMVAAYANLDLVLSLFTLDPAHGGEHLATWATDAVAIVTAGKSTSVRINSIGEMVRLSGARLGSVVVLNADKNDGSLGQAVMSF